MTSGSIGASMTRASTESASSRSKPINGSVDVPQLRPFFGYYGGKWRDALKHYPEPRHATIVEPFAGSAGFALRYADRKVILCEVDPVLAAVWRYLIRVKAKEILSIPDLAPGESVDDLKVSQEAKWLVGFWLNRGTASPRKSPSKWMRDGIRPGSFWGDRVRQTIASQVDAIRHWELHNCSYAELPVPRAATWFVDPPYESAGRYYRFGSEQIDYSALAAWCKSRPGQVIVCENEGATWLPFRELADVKTTRADRRSREVYWLNTFGAPENGQRPSSKRRPGSTQQDDWEEALEMNATGDGADAVECPECGSYCRATCDGARGDREADEAYDAMCGGEA